LLWIWRRPFWACVVLVLRVGGACATCETRECIDTAGWWVSGRVRGPHHCLPIVFWWRHAKPRAWSSMESRARVSAPSVPPMWLHQYIKVWLCARYEPPPPPQALASLLLDCVPSLRGRTAPSNSYRCCRPCHYGPAHTHAHTSVASVTLERRTAIGRLDLGGRFNARLHLHTRTEGWLHARRESGCVGCP
jgi:hypothetical protein